MFSKLSLIMYIHIPFPPHTQSHIYRCKYFIWNFYFGNSKFALLARLSLTSTYIYKYRTYRFLKKTFTGRQNTWQKLLTLWNVRYAHLCQGELCFAWICFTHSVCYPYALLYSIPGQSLGRFMLSAGWW